MLKYVFPPRRNSIMCVTLELWRFYKGAVRILNPRPLAPKARIIPLDQRPTTGDSLKNMLDGIQTRNPQIRSLMRYPLRHEHLLVNDRSTKVCIFHCIRHRRKKKIKTRQQRDSNSRGIASN